MPSEEDIKNNISFFLAYVWGVSDRNYQKRVWKKPIGPEVDDLNETFMIISDWEESTLPEYKKYKITDAQYNVIKEFLDHFLAFGEAQSDVVHASEFINTPEWIEITEKAKRVLDAFNYKADNSIRYKLSILRAYIYFFFRKFRKYTPLDTYKGRKFKVDYLDSIAVITYKDLIYSLAEYYDFRSFVNGLTWTYRELLEAPIFYEITEKQKVVLNALGTRADDFYEDLKEDKSPEFYRNCKEWKEIEALAEVVIEAFEYKPRRLKPPPGVYDYEKKLSPLELFLLNIEKVANKRYQKRVWIREVGPEWDTYYQTAKKLLKLNDPTLFDVELSKKQKEAIENFYDLFEAFHRDSSYYPEWFINHVDWKELIDLANDVIKAFNYKKRRGPIYWTRVFFSYIRYFLRKFKNLKLTPSPSPYR